jgi:hypothetical protein
MKTTYPDKLDQLVLRDEESGGEEGLVDSWKVEATW